MYAISDVICDVYVVGVSVCYVLGYVARLSQQRNPSTTLQQSYSPPSQRKTSRKKYSINIKHTVCDEWRDVCVLCICAFRIGLCCALDIATQPQYHTTLTCSPPSHHKENEQKKIMNSQAQCEWCEICVCVFCVLYVELGCCFCSPRATSTTWNQIPIYAPHS